MFFTWAHIFAHYQWQDQLIKMNWFVEIKFQLNEYIDICIQLEFNFNWILKILILFKYNEVNSNYTIQKNDV